jgi:hypothetical protein
LHYNLWAVSRKVGSVQLLFCLFPVYHKVSLLKNTSRYRYVANKISRRRGRAAREGVARYIHQQREYPCPMLLIN